LVGNPIDPFSFTVTDNVTTIEAAPIVDDRVPGCKNFDHLVEFCSSTNFACLHFPPSTIATLNEPQRKRRRPIDRQELWEKFLTIRAVLSPLLFSTGGGNCPGHQGKLNFAMQFKLDQMDVYASVLHQPVIFPHLKVNMPWINHIINFFVGYSIGHEYLHGRFWDHYSAHDEKEKPHQLWNSKLDSGAPSTLGRVWKGTYSYLDRTDFDNLRHQESTANSNLLHDRNIDNKYPIQTIKLWVPVYQGGVPTTATFEPYFDNILNSTSIFGSTTDPATVEVLEQAKKSTYTYEGIGFDEENFYATGHITPLPPQSGIPGFQRLTMMKFFRDVDTGEIDLTCLWAYEGVILPGGKIIVGRWWQPEPQVSSLYSQYSGPFILWNVDSSCDEGNLNVSFSHGLLLVGLLIVLGCY
jgi:hypothetical protein